MPEIKLDRVVSVSSEDKKYPATNLLGPAGSGKWKSGSAGEKQLSVILQFKSSCKLSGIHVGNDGSAFVEVLVGKESAASDNDWKVILVASSLMTPADARSNTNLHKVRMFSADKLSKSDSEEKWDRAKVICTQPFNKSQQYGLSFISFLTDEESKDKSKSIKLGAYTLNDGTDSDEPSRTTGGSVFSNRARLQANIPPPTAAAAVRAAAREADQKVGVKKERDTSKPSPASKADSKAVKRPAPSITSEPPKSKQKKASSAPTAEAARADGSPSASEFKDILKGVVFALSGFKNPKRADLREKAISLGARYAPDWDKNCTHLICAFTTTPKFSQVNGKGYIVTDDWILDSHKLKKKQSWRDYRLGRAKSPPRAKEDDEKDELAKKSEESPISATAAHPKKEDFDTGSTDIDSDDGAGQPDATQVDSDATEIDTDDEIAAHLASDTSPSKGKALASGKTAVVKQSKELPTGSRRSLPILPDYLLDKTFFLYGEVANRRSVYRCIHAYGGQVEEYMCDEVKFVITDNSWDDNFDSALRDNDSLVFVKSKWINDIHAQQKFIPHQKYAIVP